MAAWTGAQLRAKLADYDYRNGYDSSSHDGFAILDPSTSGHDQAQAHGHGMYARLMPSRPTMRRSPHDTRERHPLQRVDLFCCDGLARSRNPEIIAAATRVPDRRWVGATSSTVLSVAR